MVPPRRRMPVTSLAESTRDRFGSISPSKLSSRPTTSMPSLTPALTTARITAFSPGASPPPVRIPIRFSFCMQFGYSGGPAAGSVLQGPTPEMARRRAGRASGMSKSIQRDLNRCRDANARGILGGPVVEREPATVAASGPYGRLAQLGERRVRNAEVASSILAPSTNPTPHSLHAPSAPHAPSHLTHPTHLAHPLHLAHPAHLAHPDPVPNRSTGDESVIAIVGHSTLRATHGCVVSRRQRTNSGT